MQTGLQVGFGAPIGAEVLAAVKEKRIPLVRIDCQENRDPALAQEVLDAGLAPLVIIRSADQFADLPVGIDVELGNEPDLAHFGWTMESYIAELRRCLAALAMRPDLRLWVGAVSNLNDRGFAFLRALPWAEVPTHVGCSFHRYPELGGFGTPHRGYASREAEVGHLRHIIGPDRPMAVSEIGYNVVDFTEEQSAAHMARERAFWQSHDAAFCVAYQLIDGHDPRERLHRYGFQRLDGSWRPVTETWGMDAPDTGQSIWREYQVPVSVDDDGLEIRGSLTVRVLTTIVIPPDPEPIPDPVVPPPPPPPVADVAPIIGYTRVGPNASFADDSGPRRLQFCSYFPAVRVFRDDRDACLRQLDRVMGRWQAVRVFWHLADPFWSGSEVDPSWPNFDTVFTGFLRACWDRGLRVSLTSGDLQYLPSRDLPALFERLAGLCASVNEQVIGVTGMVNEARVNSQQGEDWAFWADLSRRWQAIYPWGLHGLSDPADQEEPAALKASCRAPATVALLHGTRQPWVDATRRAFNVRYEGHIGKPLVQDEPTGPNRLARDVYQPIDDPAQLFGIYTMQVLTGQVPTFFAKSSLTGDALDRSWGFTQLPRRWREMNIPDDIGTWALIPGHKAEAPVTARSFEDAGTGPHRCDCLVSPDGQRAYAVVYGGRGTWDLVTRWDTTFVQHTHDGAERTGTARAGESLAIPATAQVRIFELHRR